MILDKVTDIVISFLPMWREYLVYYFAASFLLIVPSIIISFVRR